jgi:hypothetical protein
MSQPEIRAMARLYPIERTRSDPGADVDDK